jgi:two-component system sensor histidine kinase UhpB
LRSARISRLIHRPDRPIALCIVQHCSLNIDPVAFIMWKSLSLPTQLSVLFCAMLTSAFAVVLASLFAFSINHLEHEREPVALLAAQVASAFNAELDSDASQREAIVRLMRRFNDDPRGALRYAAATTSYVSPSRSSFTVPAWFGRLIGAETQPSHFPVRSVGELALYPSDAADVYEKWVAFKFVVGTPLLLGLLAFGISRLTVQATLRPLREAAAAITKLKLGDYKVVLNCSGPPEVRRACAAINALAEVLASLQTENRSLMKRLVSAQDDERAEIGRDLHDEFAPLLFAARANAHALQNPNGAEQLAPLATALSGIVEAIQKTNGRLLARLRPLDLENLGLTRSITALVDGPAAKAGTLVADLKLDPALDRLDEVVARTVYRFVQEAITNVLRHAQASRAEILASIGNSIVTAEVSDNGSGMAPGASLGHGLRGMNERICALGGTFDIHSRESGTVVRCTLPIA